MTLPPVDTRPHAPVGDVPRETGPVYLVGYDGSAPSARALQWAVRHARHGGRVIVAHAEEPVPAQASAAAKRLLHADDLRRADALFGPLEDDARLAGCDLRCQLVPGDSAAAALLRAARRQRVDAIVVGSHGYGPIASLLGSVTQRLIRESPVPVMVIGPHAVP